MKTHYLFICIFILFTSQVIAQQKTLQQCISIAWENNISVKQTELQKRSGAISLRQAKESRYPNLNAGSSFNISGRAVDPTNNQLAENSFYTNNYNLSSNVLLYAGGRIKNNITRARLNNEAIDHQVDDIKQNIALQVASAYLNVLFSEENYTVAKNRTLVTEEQLSQLEKLIAAGLRPKNAIYELQATLAINQQSEIAAEGNKALSRLQLNQIMRIPADESFQLVIPDVLLAELEDPFSMTAISIYNEAYSRQPSIKNTQMQIQLAEIDKEISKASLRPTLAVGGSLGTNYSSLGKINNGQTDIIVDQTIFIDNQPVTVGFPQTIPNFVDQPFGDQLTENITYGYGVSLSVPIYNNYSNKSQISQAELGIENANLNHQQNLDQFRIEVEQALLDARNAKKQYDAAEKSIEAAQRAMENTENAYKSGASNIYDFNIATNNYDTAVLQGLIAKYDYIFKMKVIDFYKGKSINF